MEKYFVKVTDNSGNSEKTVSGMMSFEDAKHFIFVNNGGFNPAFTERIGGYVLIYKAGEYKEPEYYTEILPPSVFVYELEEMIDSIPHDTLFSTLEKAVDAITGGNSNFCENHEVEGFGHKGIALHDIENAIMENGLDRLTIKTTGDAMFDIFPALAQKEYCITRKTVF